MSLFKNLQTWLYAWYSKKVNYKDCLEGLKRDVDERDIALAHRYFKGVIEKFEQLKTVLARHSNLPLEKYPDDYLMTMLIGTYGLLFMRQADYAIINETVEIVKGEFSGLTAMTNGILRTIGRKKESILDELKRDSKKNRVHPELFRALKSQYSKKQIDHYLEKIHQPARIELLSMIDPEKLVKELSKEGIVAHKEDSLPFGLWLDSARGLFDSEAFKKGLFYVQSFSSQRVAALINQTRGGSVLDLCASPGGKSIAMKRYAPKNQYWLNDQSKEKLIPIRENFMRLGLGAKGLSAWNATRYQKRWKEAFDVVLLDAPCSGTGILQRNPEIALKRNTSQLKQVQKTQQHLLHQASRYVKNKGFLIYSTCSILYSENQLKIKEFLDTHRDFVKWEIKGQDVQEGFLCIEPFKEDRDGFFAAILYRE